MYPAAIAIAALIAFVLGVLFHKYVVSEAQSVKSHVTAEVASVRMHVTNEAEKLRADVKTAVESATKKI